MSRLYCLISRKLDRNATGAAENQQAVTPSLRPAVLLCVISVPRGCDWIGLREKELCSGMCISRDALMIPDRKLPL